VGLVGEELLEEIGVNQTLRITPAMKAGISTHVLFDSEASSSWLAQL
jgi:hypothetical protein